MKQFCCGDVVPGCSSSWIEDDERGILRAVADHARDTHGPDEVPSELVEAVRSQVRDVA